eukprot:TRINITY_DN4642_c0_g1_i2.p1 TRINITY_DN4642_c0_g1~~TRINITY_DN4642_c0_g1_i2.p1  ORF type:complete len:257 (+),score=54.17 TRINITY_DN4642_c0_g1_i2:52-822(+)
MSCPKESTWKMLEESLSSRISHPDKSPLFNIALQNGNVSGCFPRFGSSVSYRRKYYKYHLTELLPAFMISCLLEYLEQQEVKVGDVLEFVRIDPKEHRSVRKVVEAEDIGDGERSRYVLEDEKTRKECLFDVSPFRYGKLRWWGEYIKLSSLVKELYFVASFDVDCVNYFLIVMTDPSTGEVLRMEGYMQPAFPLEPPKLRILNANDKEHLFSLVDKYGRVDVDGLMGWSAARGISDVIFKIHEILCEKASTRYLI